VSFDSIVKMLRKFVLCEQYSFVDRLANATSKEVVEAALYEALRASRVSGEICEGVTPYIANEDEIKELLEVLDRDLNEGLDLAKKIAIKALSIPVRREGSKE